MAAPPSHWPRQSLSSLNPSSHSNFRRLLTCIEYLERKIESFRAVSLMRYLGLISSTPTNAILALASDPSPSYRKPLLVVREILNAQIFNLFFFALIRNKWVTSNTLSAVFSKFHLILENSYADVTLIPFKHFSISTYGDGDSLSRADLASRGKI